MAAGLPGEDSTSSGCCSLRGCGHLKEVRNESTEYPYFKTEKLLRRKNPTITIDLCFPVSFFNPGICRC